MPSAFLADQRNSAPARAQMVRRAGQFIVDMMLMHVQRFAAAHGELNDSTHDRFISLSTAALSPPKTKLIQLVENGDEAETRGPGKSIAATGMSIQ